MRRLAFTILAGLVVLLGSGTSAQAFFHHRVMFHGGQWYGQPVAPVGPMVSAAPISPMDILGWWQLVQAVAGGVQDLRHSRQDQGDNTTPARCTVTADVVQSLDNSDTNLKAAVDATNDLMKMVRDPKYQDKLKDKIEIVKPGTQTGGVGGGKTLPLPKPGGN